MWVLGRPGAVWAQQCPSRTDSRWAPEDTATALPNSPCPWGSIFFKNRFPLCHEKAFFKPLSIFIPAAQYWFLNKSFLRWSIISPVCPGDRLPSWGWTPVVYALDKRVAAALGGKSCPWHREDRQINESVTGWRFLRYCDVTARGHVTADKVLVTSVEGFLWQKM